MAPLDDLKRNDLVGKYAQVIGVIERDEGGSQFRLSTLKFFILEDPTWSRSGRWRCLPR
jgi:hypothetical protein